MKIKILPMIIALFAMTSFVSAVMAQQKPAQAPAAAASAPQEMKLEKFSGVIEKVDSAAKDVLVQTDKEKMTFSVSDKTKIMEGMKSFSFGDLKKGMWASVEYKKEGNKLVAEAINVSSSKPVSKMESSQSAKASATTEKK